MSPGDLVIVKPGNLLARVTSAGHPNDSTLLVEFWSPSRCAFSKFRVVPVCNIEPAPATDRRVKKIRALERKA